MQNNCQTKKKTKMQSKQEEQRTENLVSKPKNHNSNHNIPTNNMRNMLDASRNDSRREVEVGLKTQGECVPIYWKHVEYLNSPYFKKIL